MLRYIFIGAIMAASVTALYMTRATPKDIEQCVEASNMTPEECKNLINQ